MYQQLIEEGVMEERSGITNFTSGAADNRMVVFFSALNSSNVVRTENYCVKA
jgi:hypothetical protein